MAHKFSGIYGIRSKSKPERKYIGSTYDIGKRFREHKNRLKLNKHENRKLQRHVNKYGIDDLIFDILVKCPVESLLKTEQKFLDTNNFYFNICKVAGSHLGLKRSKQSCLKMKGNKNAATRRVIDIKTGKIYGSTVEAGKTVNMDRYRMYYELHLTKNKKTNFELLT